MSIMAQLSGRTIDSLRRARRRFFPKERLSTAQWTDRYRRLAGGLLPGKFLFHNQPALEGILDAFDDPYVREVWGQKCAQFGWTQGVTLNVIFKRVHLQPSPILVLFPKDGSGKRFMREKVEPEARATPEIAARINTGARRPDNTQDYKAFPGGYLQLVGTNSPANVKSTDAPLVFVEEPDDTSKDLRGQGDSVALGRERVKSYGEHGKLGVGGTPTVEGLSKVAAGMERSDKRRYYVACPHCGHEQTLRWDQVDWQSDALLSHPVYGTHRPETARYRCEADECGALWSDAEKNAAVRAAAGRADKGWRATAPFNGIAGFYINELMSVSVGSPMELLVRKFLEASHKLKSGDDSHMRSFVNNQLGETWQLKSDAPEVEQLRERAESYAQWTTPAGGLICVASVDVQRGGESGEPRLEYVVKAFGRGMESWLVAYGVVPGNPLEPATWDALDPILNKPVRNLGGGTLGISAVSIDSSDGMTQDAVYRYARRRKHRGFMAIKGSANPHKEIFSPPSQSIDTNATDKAAKYGLKLYWVGVEKAKDLISGRIKLAGDGPGRMHFCADLGDNYFAGLTSEVKVPGPRGRPVWTKKAGARNEPLDLEVYALHAAHKLRVHTWTESQWVAVEEKVRQRELLEDPRQGDAPATVATVPRGTSPVAGTRFEGFGSRRGL
ncbi:MAG TPA: terminase gpA endonuclease subunit [Nevskiaceae bacterium]|nr:terminase gpA endonuclease subunit [Nevskiaceae bacterium]